MSAPTLLAVLVAVVSVPLNWFVVVRLWRLSLVKPSIPVLRFQAILATGLSAIVTLFALIFLNNDLPDPVVSGDTTKLITRSVVLIWSVIPSLYWLWLYRKARS